MLIDYVQKAMDRAHYEIIADDEPFYGEVPDLEGVWATATTLESCRKRLAEAVEDWLLFRLSKGLQIPPLDGIEIQLPQPVPD
jgi:predicted RNase H-like HicB family nuclease